MATISRGFLELLTREWRPQPDDTVGGWCVTLGEDPRSPGAGALVIAMFLSREVAVHIAEVHNRSLLRESPPPGEVSGEAAGPPPVPSQTRGAERTEPWTG
jgi:hypothetical protein